MEMQYKILLQTFEDVKAENKCLKNKSSKSSCIQLDELDILRTKVSMLMTENENM